MLASHDREHAEDHHFEPVNYRRDIIRTKNATRKIKRKKRQKLAALMGGTSSYSISSSRVDRPELAALDETDDVPDIPFPVADYPDYTRDESGRGSVAISMVEQGGKTGGSYIEDEEKMSDHHPLSPRVVVVSRSRSRNTDV